jgi:hypothetical protein
MVPSTYVGYFTAASTAAGALIGLLFVAVALRADTIFGDKARRSGEALAITAFTGLVNSFFVSLLALLPLASLGETAAIMAVISIVSTIRLNRRIAKDLRHIFTVVITLGTYTYQLAAGLVLMLHQHDDAQVAALSYLVFASMAVALRRAWQLMQGKHLDAAELAAAAASGPAAPY